MKEQVKKAKNNAKEFWTLYGEGIVGGAFVVGAAWFGYCFGWHWHEKCMITGLENMSE